MSLLNLGYCTFAEHHEKSLVLRFCFVSVDQLFENFDFEKRNYCFGKKSGKSLEFWIQNLYEPRCTLNLFEVSEAPLPTPRAVDKGLNDAKHLTR